MPTYELTEGWTPTADNVNALPDPVRLYIHDLETNCDPSGIVRENVLMREENKGLRLECENMAAAIITLKEALQPFAKMAKALKRVDDEVIITSDSLERTAELPNYYLATRDLRAARDAIAAVEAGQ